MAKPPIMKMTAKRMEAAYRVATGHVLIQSRSTEEVRLMINNVAYTATNVTIANFTPNFTSLRLRQTLAAPVLKRDQKKDARDLGFENESFLCIA